MPAYGAGYMQQGLTSQLCLDIAKLVDFFYFKL